MRRWILVTALLLAAGCATDLGPLYRADPGISQEAFVAAAESDRPEDAAALLVLGHLATVTDGTEPEAGQLATALEALATRADRDALTPAQRLAAGHTAATLATDELQDPAVRMNACALLAALGDEDSLRAVAEEAADPLVADHAAELLER